jgi:fructose-1,6-bisphosphatase/inositol monophosphatase family enzyme
MLQSVEEAYLYAKYSQGDPSVEVRRKPNPALHGTPDYVTAVDENSQTKILGYLKGKFPEVGALAEEAGMDREDAHAKKGDKRWVLDPIDSTRNYVAGTPDYSISLAYQEFDNGHWDTKASVIAAPGHDKIFWAEKGKGAYVIELVTVQPPFMCPV